MPGDGSAESSSSGTDDSGGEDLDREREALMADCEEEMRRGGLKVATAKASQSECGSRDGGVARLG